MKLLLLGGTADARRLCAELAQACPELGLIYSVAGLVRQPQVAAEVISGGFSPRGGLGAYCRDAGVGAVLDATHPYTTAMGAKARQVCGDLGLPYWRFLRPHWQEQAGDEWYPYPTLEGLVEGLAEYSRVLLTVGQVPTALLQRLAGLEKVVLRTAAAPAEALPAGVEWVKAVGPFALDDELNLLRRHGIQALASKNSGGASTAAKLTAARQLGLPVLMLERPPGAAGTDNQDALVAAIVAWHRGQNP